MALLSSRLLTLTLSLSFEGICESQHSIEWPNSKRAKSAKHKCLSVALTSKRKKTETYKYVKQYCYCSSKLLGYSGTRYFLSSFLCCSESTSSALLRRKALCKYQPICPAGADQMHELHLHSVLILLLWHPRLSFIFPNTL